MCECESVALCVRPVSVMRLMSKANRNNEVQFSLPDDGALGDVDGAARIDRTTDGSGWIQQ